MSALPETQTPSLDLIPYEPAFRDALEAQLQEKALTEWLPFSYPLNSSEIDTMLGQLVEPGQAGMHFWMAQDANDPDAGFVGALGMQATGYQHLAQIYYWVSPDYQGRGIATEMLNIISDACFHDWNFARVQALVAPNNVPSIRALEKSGFTLEGLLRRYYMNSMSDPSQLIDVYMYAKIKE